MKAMRAVICAALLSLSLSGCVSLSEFFASLGFSSSDDSVELPQYRVGDAFTFGSPNVTWRVVSIANQRVTWRNEKGDEQVTEQNPLLPALAWRSSKNGSGQRIISDKVGSLFPMKVGARTTFRAAVTTDKPPYGWGFNWQCEVLDRQDVVGATGEIDAFKIGCGRETADEIVFFYAPKIGHYIAKTSRAGGANSSRIRHLIAYERISDEGSLERIAFSGRLQMGNPSAEAESITRNVPVQSATVVRREPQTETVRAATGIEGRAQELLAQRKSIDAPRARNNTAHLDSPSRSATEVAAIAPAAGQNHQTPSVQKSKNMAGYQLVTPTIPQFPPRPKANPQREMIRIAKANDRIVRAPTIPRTIEDIPTLQPNDTPNPFQVSIVKKAYAAPDKSGAMIREARARALRTPGMGDEAMLAVRGKQLEASSAGKRASLQNRVELSTAKARSTISRRATAPLSQLSEQVASLSPRKSTVSSQPADKERFFGIHLGTFMDPKKALRGWQYIYKSHKDILNGLQPRIRRHDLGAEGVRYRLRVVPFVSAASANGLCARLAKRGKFCRVTLE